MFALRTLLLPVDFSKHSLEAARQANGLAAHSHSRLIVLNVVRTDRRTLQFEAAGCSAQELQ
jgi:nucleotide-binding universal stress UspA family protein